MCAAYDSGTILGGIDRLFGLILRTVYTHLFPKPTGGKC